jgi:hypothetical protein
MSRSTQSSLFFLCARGTPPGPADELTAVALIPTSSVDRALGFGAANDDRAKERKKKKAKKR